MVCIILGPNLGRWAPALPRKSLKFFFNLIIFRLQFSSMMQYFARVRWAQPGPMGPEIWAQGPGSAQGRALLHGQNRGYWIMSMFLVSTTVLKYQNQSMSFELHDRKKILFLLYLTTIRFFHSFC